jgi:hypothetical protein
LVSVSISDTLDIFIGIDQISGVILGDWQTSAKIPVIGQIQGCCFWMLSLHGGKPSSYNLSDIQIYIKFI